MESVKDQWAKNRAYAVEVALDAAHRTDSDLAQYADLVQYHIDNIKPTPTGWAACMNEGIRKLREAARYFEEASKAL